MHAILPLISSNWQHNPTFSVPTSPVLHASAQLHLHQSSASQASEELLCSWLHFSSEVRITSQTWWVLGRGTSLVTGGLGEGEMRREDGVCMTSPPQKQQNSKQTHLHLELSCYQFCQPTSKYSSWTPPG